MIVTEHPPQIVSYDYFHTLRVPLDRGRYFDQRDQVNTTVVAVVSQRAAERFWPHSDPIGQRLRLTGRSQNYRPDGGDQTDPWLTVIGIVGNVRQRGINSEPGLDVYVSDQQLFSPESYLASRTRLEPASLLPQVKRAVWSVDPEQSDGGVAGPVGKSCLWISRTRAGSTFCFNLAGSQI